LYCRYPSRWRNASVNGGRISYKSPTTPKRASLKIGASGSLLIATITLVKKGLHENEPIPDEKGYNKFNA